MKRDSNGTIGIWTTNGFLIDKRRVQTPSAISTHTLDEEYLGTTTTHDIDAANDLNNTRKTIASPIRQPRINTLVGVEPKFRRQYYHKVVIILIVLVIVLLIVAIIILGLLLDKNTMDNICRTKECLRTAANLIYSMDLMADPCHDFYQFTCGHWSEEHPRSEFLTSNDWFRETQSRVMRKLRQFLKRNGTLNEPNAVAKARRMYRACMDTKAMDEREMVPLWKYLKKFRLPLVPSGLNLSASQGPIRGAHFNWVRSVAMIKKYLGMDVIIGFDVFADPLNGTIKRMAFGTPEIDKALPFNNDDLYKVLKKMKRKSVYEIDDIKLERMRRRGVEENEMGDSDEEINDSDFKLKSTFHAYVVYITRLLTIYLSYMELEDNDIGDYEEEGTDLIIQAIEVARKIYQLKDLAENSTKSSLNPMDDIVYLSVRELQVQTDKLIEPETLPIWENYVKWLMESVVDDGDDVNSTRNNNMGSWQIITSHADILYLQMITEYLHEIPEEYLQFYIWLSAVEEIILHTTSEMRLLYAEYLSSTLGTESNSSPRSLYCTHAVNSLMGMAASYALADENFTRHKLPNVRHMLDNIRYAFNNLVRSTTWMDEPTKRETLRKSLQMKSFIGYPDWITNATALDSFYADIHIDAATHLENMIGVLSWDMRTVLKRINISDTIGWATSPSNVNAFHIFQSNAITVPIAILQYPFYELGLESLNYGSIGTILGHELTHGFDDSGRMFDRNGNMIQWWSNETIEEYINRTECFIQQYNQYYLEDIDEYINGELTLGENIADNGGMREAYYAYKFHETKNGKELRKLPGLENYTHEQLFFISFGNLWCESLSPAASRYALDDTHCPGKVRLKGVLTNSQEFARAFQCQPGTKMNPANKKKCRIW